MEFNDLAVECSVECVRECRVNDTIIDYPFSTTKGKINGANSYLFANRAANFHGILVAGSQTWVSLCHLLSIFVPFAAFKSSEGGKRWKERKRGGMQVVESDGRGSGGDVGDVRGSG